MANVDWTDPGTSGDWDNTPNTTNWTGLPPNENFPGQSALNGDSVTIGASNSAYIVTFNVLSATIGSLEIDGGNGANHQTILQMTAGDTLNIVGGVTLLKKDSNGEIDGAGTISATGQIVATGSTAVEGTVTAGTDTTGGVLDLTGTGSAASNIVFAIGTAAPSTLELNLSGGVAATGAISINNVNQTLEIGPVGAVAISATQNVTNGTILMGGGTLTDTSGISFGTTSSSGSLSGFGTVAGTLTMSGTGTANTVTATGGNLILTTAIGSNSGLVFAIDSTAASDLQLNADPGNGNAFTFLGSAGELALTSSAASGFNDSIVGLDVASTLTPTNLVDILGDAGVTVTSGRIGFGTTGTVTLSDGAVLDLSGITDASGAWFVNTTADSASTGTDVFLSMVCYARGTMIQTPAGERPVETLRPGMQVITLVDGNEVPRTVKWVGHRRIDLTRHPRPETAAPIRIVRDAFADNMPRIDLLLSPDHAVFVDGLLICIRQLANGSTIRMERGWTAVDYYHVELNEHAILLAEGLPVESYLDTGNRGFFANSGAPLVLHPDLPNENRYPTRETDSCAPFVSDAASVQPIWQRFVDRAAAIGRPESQRVTTTDAGLHLQCPGRQTIEPIYCDRQCAIFILPDAAAEVRLVSRAQVPTQARPWLDDQRQLGVRVKRLVLRGADETREAPLDRPDLTRGWWAVEHDGPIMSRWTDGEAVLPLPTMRGTIVLEVHLAGAMTYVLDVVTEGVTERRVA